MIKTSEIKRLAERPRPGGHTLRATELYTACQRLLELWWNADEAALVMATEWVGQLADELPRRARENAARDLALMLCSLVEEQDDGSDNT